MRRIPADHIRAVRDVQAVMEQAITAATWPCAFWICGGGFQGEGRRMKDESAPSFVFFFRPTRFGSVIA